MPVVRRLTGNVDVLRETDSLLSMEIECRLRSILLGRLPQSCFIYLDLTEMGKQNDTIGPLRGEFSVQIF